MEKYNMIKQGMMQELLTGKTRVGMTETQNVPEGMSVKMLATIKVNNNITIPELAEIIGVTTRTIERYAKKLQEEGKLTRISPDKDGHWEIIEDKT